MKLAGQTSYGNIPKEFLDSNYEMMQFHIHDFANIKLDKGGCFFTNTIKAHGHLWKLSIYPRGDCRSNTDTEYVAMFLYCAGENDKSDPVVAKASFQTKTINHPLPKYEFSKSQDHWGEYDAYKRDDIIKNDCNKDGTLTITVELQVATGKRSVLFPDSASNDDILSTIFNSTDTADVIFVVGSTANEFFGHKCVLAVRAKALYELVLVEEFNNEGSDNKIKIPHIDEEVFKMLLQLTYTGKEPELNDNDSDEEFVKSILLTADRFGCTDLKLFTESVIVEKFLVPSNSAALLLLADSRFMCIAKGSCNEHVY
jgi:hypothetical protein